MTYQLVTAWLEYRSYPGITCLICGRTSYNRHDIDQRYCGHCHRFHKDPVPETTP
jgi:hypothetical protein